LDGVEVFLVCAFSKPLTDEMCVDNHTNNSLLMICKAKIMTPHMTSAFGIDEIDIDGGIGIDTHKTHIYLCIIVADLSHARRTKWYFDQIFLIT
jgi:hypothetical protein